MHNPSYKSLNKELVQRAQQLKAENGALRSHIAVLTSTLSEKTLELSAARHELELLKANGLNPLKDKQVAILRPMSSSGDPIVDSIAGNPKAVLFGRSPGSGRQCPHVGRSPRSDCETHPRMERPKRKAAPAPSSLVEPKLNTKMRRPK